MVATTYYDFNPSNTAPTQFQPTLDGQVYTVLVSWNLFGQRWYATCYDLAGNLQFNLPLIGSPLDYDISLTAGYFTTKLVWRVANNQFEVIS